MRRLPVAVWISNAAAVLFGRWGDVTQHADTVGCSRQTIYDHAQKVRAAVEDAHDGGPTRAEWIERHQQLRHENAQLWAWLAGTIDFLPSKQREFSVTAAAMGLSLNQVLVLLALSDDGTPSFDRENAVALAELGVPAFACTPDVFPDLLAVALSRGDVGAWAHRQDAANATLVAPPEAASG